MVYEAWPDLSARCLLCHTADCAIYRGYYTRYLFCPEMEFLGLLVIRTAYCKKFDVRFTLLPDFVIRYRRISRLSLERFYECFQSAGSDLKSAIDKLTEGLSEEFYLPLSTAHAYVLSKTAVPP